MCRRGFTLLELALVLTIAAIAMALAVPRIAATRDGAAVRGAVGEVAATFEAARQMAITRRTTVAVVLDTIAGAIELRAGGQPILRRGLRTAYGIVLGANRDSAVYDSRGLGYGVSNISVTVRRGGIVDTLTMSRLGRVRW
jgi:prepilin-type N-terminal cleavage/methylation domain-containing protein